MQSKERLEPTTTQTIHQVADRLRVSSRTVWSWIAAGRLRALKLGPRTTRITEDAIEEFLRRCAEKGE